MSGFACHGNNDCDPLTWAVNQLQIESHPMQPQTLYDAGMVSLDSLDTYSVSVTPYGELITCLICKVTCCGRIPYSQHLQGALHRKRSNHQEPTSCSICDKHFCSSDELNLHLSGVKHRKKALLASSTATANETASGTFKCIPCNLECSSQLQLSDHLKGRKHLKCIKFKSADWNCDVLLPSALTSTHSTSEDCTASVGQKGRPFATNTSKSLCSKSEDLFERLIALESAIQNSSSHSLPSLQHCYKESDNLSNELCTLSSGIARSPAWTTPTNTSTQRDVPFCKHRTCIVHRALLSYELTLAKVPDSTKSEK